MRWLLVLVCGCSFPHGMPSDGGAAGDGMVGDGRLGDTGGADASIDASSTCIAMATQTFEQHHYFATGNANWQGARNECASVGGHLVKIESPAENAFVTATFTNSFFTWIGLHDPTSANVYTWTDGTLLGVSFNAFPNGVPPLSNGDCVDVGTNGEWDPYMCSYSGHGGVCECE
ncbi:MAG TPA: C-type lectin domain-containing protein [Kofleriaceae bacterium]